MRDWVYMGKKYTPVCNCDSDWYTDTRNPEVKVLCADEEGVSSQNPTYFCKECTKYPWIKVPV